MNRAVNESIKSELEQLEEDGGLGRVSVRGSRQVHAAFGFEQIEPDDQKAAARPRTRDVASQLDEAWSRLKRRIQPEK